MKGSTIRARVCRETNRARILDALQVDRIVDAAQVAQQLNMSDRTVYRHVAGLRKQGWTIPASTGLGYAGWMVKPPKDT